MQIETAEARRLEDQFWQQQAIRDDDSDVHCMGAKRVRFALQALRMQNRNVEACGRLVHRRAAFLHPSPRARGGTRVGGNDFVSSTGELDERRYRELGSTHEDDAQPSVLYAHVILRCEREARASKDDVRSRGVILRGPLRGHLRMTDLILKNTSLCRFALGGLCVFLDHAVTLELRKVVNEQHTIDVIDLMLNDAR